MHSYLNPKVYPHCGHDNGNDGEQLVDVGLDEDGDEEGGDEADAGEEGLEHQPGQGERGRAVVAGVD